MVIAQANADSYELRVQFIASNPNEMDAVRLDKEYRIVKEKLEGRPFTQLGYVPAAKLEELQKAVIGFSPTMLHLAGHCNEKGEYLMESERGLEGVVTPETLFNLVKAINDNNESPLRCVLLNTCYSSKVVDVLAAEVDVCIGYHDLIDDDVVLAFAEGFYTGILTHKSIQSAITMGKDQIKNHGLKGYHQLKFSLKTGMCAEDIILFPKPNPLVYSWLRFTSLSNYKKIAVSLAPFILVPILLWLCGTGAFRARELYLDLGPLTYPLTTVLLTGGDVVWSSLISSLGSLFSEVFWIRLTAWLIVFLGIFLFWAHRRVPSLVLFVLVSAWLGFLFTGFFFSAISVHARNQIEESERRDPGVNRVDRAIFESWSWLYNDSALNNRRRENLHGLFLWLIAGGLFGVYLGSRCPKRTKWMVRGASVLLLFFMVSRLPQAYAYAVWGLKYPQVTLVRDPLVSFPPELKAGCCLFDVSAGALETVLWIRCPGDYPGRWLIPEEGVTHRLQRMGKPLVVVNSPCDQKE